MSLKDSKIQALQVEVEIAAPVDKVWTALIDEIGDWWPADFYAGGTNGSRTFKIEPEPGGRMMEVWDGGGGMLWGTVVTSQPTVRLQILGSIFPNWGGPTQQFGTWELETVGAGTRLRYSEHAVGEVSESGGEEKTVGWQFLSDTLKAHVEGAAAPTWGD